VQEERFASCSRRTPVAKKHPTKTVSDVDERHQENQRRFAEVLVRRLLRDGVSPEEAYRRAGLPMPDQRSA